MHTLHKMQNTFLCILLCIYKGLCIRSFTLLNPFSQKLHPFELHARTGLAACKVCALPTMPQVSHVRGQGQSLPAVQLCLLAMNPWILPACFIFLRYKRGGSEEGWGHRACGSSHLPRCQEIPCLYVWLSCSQTFPLHTPRYIEYFYIYI